MPHIHGVLWLKLDGFEKDHSRSQLQTALSKIYSGNFSSIDPEYDTVVTFIDEFVTCELNEDDNALFEIVTNVQRHHHTKTCSRRGQSCRFNYPRFPSERTILAKPLSTDIDPEKRKKLLDNHRTDQLWKVRASMKT